MRLLKIWWVSDVPLNAENIEALRRIHSEAKIFPEQKIVEDIVAFIENFPRDFVYVDRCLLANLNLPNRYGILVFHAERNKNDGSSILSAVFHVNRNGKLIERKVWARPEPNGEGIVLQSEY